MIELISSVELIYALSNAASTGERELRQAQHDLASADDESLPVSTSGCTSDDRPPAALDAGGGAASFARLVATASCVKASLMLRFSLALVSM